MRSSPLAAAQGSIPRSQRGSCFVRFRFSPGTRVGLLLGACLRQSFMDQPRDLDALLDSLILDELEGGGESRLEPAAQLRLHEPGRVLQAVHAQVLFLV